MTRHCFFILKWNYTLASSTSWKYPSTF